MALTCNPTALNGNECLDPTGGWIRAQVFEFSDIASITYDNTDTSQVTAIALTSPAVPVLLTPAAADGTTYTVAMPERDNQVSAPILYNINLGAQIKGFTAAQRAALEGYLGCCSLVAVVDLNNGETIVLGLEKNGTGFKAPVVPLFLSMQNIEGGNYTGGITNTLMFKATHKSAPMFGKNLAIS